MFGGGSLTFLIPQRASRSKKWFSDVLMSTINPSLNFVARMISIEPSRQETVGRKGTPP